MITTTKSNSKLQVSIGSALASADRYEAKARALLADGQWLKALDAFERKICWTRYAYNYRRIIGTQMPLPAVPTFSKKFNAAATMAGPTATSDFKQAPSQAPELNSKLQISIGRALVKAARWEDRGQALLKRGQWLKAVDAFDRKLFWLKYAQIVRQGKTTVGHDESLPDFNGAPADMPKSADAGEISPAIATCSAERV